LTEVVIQLSGLMILFALCTCVALFTVLCVHQY